MKINRLEIEKILAERQMTKTTLADSCGIARQNLSTILNRGTCEPKTVGILAKGLGVPIATISGE